MWRGPIAPEVPLLRTTQAAFTLRLTELGTLPPVTLNCVLAPLASVTVAWKPGT